MAIPTPISAEPRSGVGQTRSGQGRGLDHPRCAVPGPFRTDGAGLLHRLQLPGGLSRQRLLWRCTAPGMRAIPPATRWCGSGSRTASRSMDTRISPPVSGTAWPNLTSRPRSGAARWGLAVAQDGSLLIADDVANVGGGWPIRGSRKCRFGAPSREGWWS